MHLELHTSVAARTVNLRQLPQLHVHARGNAHYEAVATGSAARMNSAGLHTHADSCQAHQYAVKA
jgi:hypothetical protein